MSCTLIVVVIKVIVPVAAVNNDSLSPVIAVMVVPMFPPTPLTVSPPPHGRCFCRQCGLCFHGCCHLPATMIMTCCSAKVYFSKNILNRQSTLVKRHASIARRREHLSAYQRICISGRQQNHKIIKKNQERIIRHRLKKNVLAGSNAYLRICNFLKKSKPNMHKCTKTTAYESSRSFEPAKI
jgi:hypothetical protein